MGTSDEELDLPDEGRELFEHFHLKVDRGQALLRIDKFLGMKLEHISRNRIQQAVHAQCITVNGSSIKSNYKVKPGDEISIVLPYPPNEFEITAEEIPLTIVFEDNDLIVVNKPAGMVVHPAKGNYTGTLLNALLWHFKDVPYFKEGGIRPGLVHRIDKDTSGILVVAKNELAHTVLARQFFDKVSERKYLALVWGTFNEKQGTIRGNLGRSLRDRKKMAVYEDEETGKHAVTHYTILKEFKYVSLVECRLETGRTHQIRAHFEYIKHPLFNDAMYGGDIILKGNTFAKYRQFVENCFAECPRQALHAKSLGFFHPVTKKWLFFDSDLPQDMQKLVNKWEKYIITVT